MKLTRQNMGNVAVALVAALLFAGFVFLATKGDNKGSNLATVAPTTTIKRVTTTTEEPTSTTEWTLDLSTSTSAAPVATTITTRTTTTSKPKATTTTAKNGCVSGQQTESTDNKNTFTYDSSGWVSGSSSNQPGSSSFPLDFTITTERGDGNQIKFVASLTNNTGCTATFGGNVVIAVTLHPTGGGDDQTFTISPPQDQAVTDIKAHETIKLTQPRTIAGSGTFEATGAVVINYG